MKTWINRAIEYLKHSLEPIPQEINEIDWNISVPLKWDELNN